MKDKVVQSMLSRGAVSLPPDLLWGYRSLGLSEGELVLVLLLLGFSQQSGESYPDLDELARVMDTPVVEVQEKVASLMEKGLLAITSEMCFVSGEKQQIFCLDPLFDRLGEFMAEQESRQRERYQKKKKEALVIKDEAEERDSIYTVFEKEFGRMLSPMEQGYLQEWLNGDQFSRGLVYEALRSAVSREKRSFKYIDTILRNWTLKGIKTAREARLEDQNFSARRKNPGRDVREKPQEKDKEAATSFRKKTNYDDLIMN